MLLATAEKSWNAGYVERGQVFSNSRNAVLLDSPGTRRLCRFPPKSAQPSWAWVCCPVESPGPTGCNPSWPRSRSSDSRNHAPPIGRGVVLTSVAPTRPNNGSIGPRETGRFGVLCRSGFRDRQDPENRQRFAGFLRSSTNDRVWLMGVFRQVRHGGAEKCFFSSAKLVVGGRYAAIVGMVGGKTRLAGTRADTSGLDRVPKMSVTIAPKPPEALA